MLRFYTAGESHGQALLTFLSGLPGGCRWTWNSSITICTAGSLAMDVVGGRRSRKIALTSLRECVTARPSERLSPCALRIGIGQAGKRYFRWKLRAAPKLARGSW